VATAPRLKAYEWPRVRCLESELDVDGLDLETGETIGKRKASALLAYVIELAAELTDQMRSALTGNDYDDDDAVLWLVDHELLALAWRGTCQTDPNMEITARRTALGDEVARVEIAKGGDR